MYPLLISITIIAVVFGLFYISSRFGRLSAADKSLEKIREKWGKPVSSRRNFDLIEVYLNATQSPDKLSASTIDDLDLKSVFNYIDRTSSKPGKQYLYKKLHEPETNIESLLKLDDNIEEINKDIPGRELIQLELSKLNSTDAYYITDLFLKRHEVLFQSVMSTYIRISPFLILIAFFSLVIVPNPFSAVVLALLFCNNIIVHFTNRSKISAYTNSLPQLLTMHKVAVWLVKNSRFKKSEAVKQNLKNLVGLKRSLAFVNLESNLVNDTADVSYGILQFIKILFLLDPYIYIASIRHIGKYREDIEAVYKYVAEIDMLIAIQSVRDGLPVSCKPEFTDADGRLEITDLYHPLVNNCVANSLYTRADRGALITGSNMSGKTTFIKSLAVNTLLAQTLFTCCARAYKAPVLKIQTSIKTTDVVEEQQSYFQKQASAILKIMDNSGANEPVKSLVIIDEIFRGTNTIERIAAAKSVLSYITANQNFVFVSTHDLELAELLDEEFAVYSFAETKQGGELVFDYTLKEGLLKSTNGIAILKSMGYPEAVIDDANIVSERMMHKYLI